MDDKKYQFVAIISKQCVIIEIQDNREILYPQLTTIFINILNDTQHGLKLYFTIKTFS